RTVRVELRTDSYASDETSWELRRSDLNASPMLDAAANSELLMAGGSPVFDGAGRAWMGQFGVGVDLDGPDETFESTTCMSEEESASRNGGCYDFRAYDTYGDGMGCGADGLIKVQVGRTRLVQRDGNMARRQEVDGAGGEKINACMDPDGPRQVGLLRGPGLRRRDRYRTPGQPVQVRQGVGAHRLEEHGEGPARGRDGRDRRR
ncbi:hypothetical protein THAOC_25252, partial [Thalassiosira oceanica]